MNLEYKNTFKNSIMKMLRHFLVLNTFLGLGTYKNYSTFTTTDIIVVFTVLNAIAIIMLLYIWKALNIYIKNDMLLVRQENKQYKIPVKKITEIVCNAKYWGGRHLYFKYSLENNMEKEIFSSAPNFLPKTIITKFLADITEINPNIKLSKDCEKWKQEYLANDTKALAKY